MTDRSHIERIVVETLKCHLAIADETVDETVDVDAELGPLGLGMNSVNHLEFLVALEKQLKVCIPDDCWDGKSLNTVTKVVDYFCSALGR